MQDPSPMKNAVEKARLPQQLDQIQKMLSVCHQAALGLSVATDRIVGSIPQNDSKDGTAPPAGTLEQRFAETIGGVESLAARLHETLKRLNAAV